MSSNKDKVHKYNLKSLYKIDLIPNKFSIVDIKTPFDVTSKEKKKKEKFKKPDKIYGPVPYEEMLKDADNYENYLNIIETYCILKNLSPEKYEKATHKIRKMIKYLREGRGDKVYDEERYEEYLKRRDEY